jgi:hypothetical protein
MTITTHAFLNDGEPRLRAERVQGARILISAPRRGSFEEVVRVVFDQNTLAGIVAAGMLGNAFWDFIKWTWGVALGREDEPGVAANIRRRERIEPTLGRLADALEQPLLEMHRPIKEGEADHMGLIRPKVGEIVRLDENTLNYVDPDVQLQHEIEAVGNVTRYNILSGYGRMFDDAVGATRSFRIVDELGAAERNLLTWSLDQRNRGEQGKLVFRSRPTTNRRGEILSHLVTGVRRQIPR